MNRHGQKDRIDWFTIAYLVFLLKMLLDASSLIVLASVVSNIFTLVGAGIILYILMDQTYKKSGIVLIISMTLLIFYTYSKASFFVIVSTYLLMLGSKEANIVDSLKAGIKVKIAFIGIHVLIYFIMLVINPSSLHLAYRNGVYRHAFYIGHPNMFSAMIVWICFEIMFIQLTLKETISWKLIGGLYIINVFFYQFTDSNTAIIVFSLFIILYVLYSKNLFAILKIISKYGFMFFSILFTFLVVIYDKLSGSLLEIWLAINEGMTSRLLYGAYAYDMHGITILGKKAIYPDKVYWKGFWVDEILFDNTYIWLLENIGTIYLVLFGLFLIYISKKTGPIEHIFIICWFIYGIMEAYILDASICFPLLLIGHYLYKKNESETETNSEDVLYKRVFTSLK